MPRFVAMRKHAHQNTQGTKTYRIGIVRLIPGRYGPTMLSTRARAVDRVVQVTERLKDSASDFLSKQRRLDCSALIYSSRVDHGSPQPADIERLVGAYVDTASDRAWASLLAHCLRHGSAEFRADVAAVRAGSRPDAVAISRSYTYAEPAVSLDLAPVAVPTRRYLAMGYPRASASRRWKVGLVELEEWFTGTPRMIHARARGVKQLIWMRQEPGPEPEYRRVLRSAEAQAKIMTLGANVREPYWAALGHACEMGEKGAAEVLDRVVGAHQLVRDYHPGQGMDVCLPFRPLCDAVGRGEPGALDVLRDRLM